VIKVETQDHPGKQQVTMQSPFTLRTDIYPTIDPASLANSLRGKNALITGSGRGIGREMALALARAGANIAVTGRTASEVQSTVREISNIAADVKSIGITANILDQKEQERLVREVREKLGNIDILICNAGSNIFQPFHLTDPDSWWGVMELNVRAPVDLTRLVLPEMRERNEGTIIFTSSRAATADLPWTTSYNCAKTAITRFAGTLQAELDQVQPITKNVQNGISVFSIHPGEIETSLHQTSFPEKTIREAPYVVEFMEKIGKKRPHFEGRLPAWTCVWLCSGRAAQLRGRYVDCTRDVEEQANSIEREKAALGRM
jgi:NAD(P)-dependent dehydrogenase (short-subunit alcohol dehydrogenase family)